MLLRLRIALPDQPGSPGKVTRVLGVAGADITRVVVLERVEGPAFHRIEMHRLSRILEIFLTLPAVERVVARQSRHPAG